MSSMAEMTPKSLPIWLAGLAFAVSLPLVLGLLGRLHPAFDSLAHFRVHLAVMLVLVALPLLFFRGWRMPGLAAIVLAFSALTATLAPASGMSARASADARAGDAGARYRLLHLNLRFDNATPERVLSLIGRVQPDVITLNEVSPMWAEKLGHIEAAYPHRIICPAPRPIGGVAILSRRPFLHPSAAQCFDRGSLAIARVQFGGQAVDIAALHLAWPWPFGQPRQLPHIERALARLSSTAILAGDLNAAPWSAAASRVATAGELRLLRGIGPTWLKPIVSPALRPYAGLPIDNVFAKGRIAPETPRRLEDIGSDHLPVLLTFGVASAEPAKVMQARLGE